jgi:hypothetical protein
MPDPNFCDCVINATWPMAGVAGGVYICDARMALALR